MEDFGLGTVVFVPAAGGGVASVTGLVVAGTSGSRFTISFTGTTMPLLQALVRMIWFVVSELMKPVMRSPLRRWRMTCCAAASLPETKSNEATICDRKDEILWRDR